MFESMKEHPDLIFQDATVKLVEVQQSIDEYLGLDLIAMLHRTDDRICNRAGVVIEGKYFILIVFLFIFFNLK